MKQKNARPSPSPSHADLEKTSAPQPGGQAADKVVAMDVLKKLRIVIRAAQRHSAWIEKQCGISGAQLWVLQELHDSPHLRVGDIARKLAIHQTTTSNLLEALQRRGYIIKARDPNDQRAVTLMLSEEGAALLERAPKPSRGLLPEALGKLDESGLRQLDLGLQALLEVIDKVDEAHALQPLPFTM